LLEAQLGLITSLTYVKIIKKLDSVDMEVNDLLYLFLIYFLLEHRSDNCKFLHDRGDYKSGWQLEKEWDAKQASKKRKLEEALRNVADDEDGNAQ
jgi:hypothetical protein